MVNCAFLANMVCMLPTRTACPTAPSRVLGTEWTLGPIKFPAVPINTNAVFTSIYTSQGVGGVGGEQPLYCCSCSEQPVEGRGCGRRMSPARPHHLPAEGALEQPGPPLLHLVQMGCTFPPRAGWQFSQECQLFECFMDVYFCHRPPHPEHLHAQMLQFQRDINATHGLNLPLLPFPSLVSQA